MGSDTNVKGSIGKGVSIFLSQSCAAEMHWAHLPLKSCILDAVDTVRFESIQVHHNQIA